MKISVATSERGDSRASPHTPWPLAAIAIGGADADQEAGNRHQHQMVGDGLRHGRVGHRQPDQRRRHQPHHEGARLGHVGILVGRQQPAEDAADPGDAAIAKHQQHGRDTDQRAADRRRDRCEFSDWRLDWDHRASAPFLGRAAVPAT